MKDAAVLVVGEFRLGVDADLDMELLSIVSGDLELLADLELAARELGLPAVLKTASFGYDGKGQQKLRAVADLPTAFANLKGAEGIYEAFVDFEKEVSVVAARTLDGEFAAFPVFENAHANHILDVTVSPARIACE